MLRNLIQIVKGASIMSKINSRSFLIVLIAGLFFSGCYTQLKITDTEGERNESKGYVDTDIPIYTNQSYIYNFTDPYYLRFLYPSYVYGYGYESFYGYVPGINNTFFAGNQNEDGDVRNKIRSSGLYSPGGEIDRRSGNNSRNETENENTRNESNGSAEQRSGDQLADNVRSRTSAVDKDRRSSERGIRTSRQNTSESVSRVAVPRHSVTSISYQQRTTAASRAVMENRLRTVSSSQDWNTGMYNVPVADFDIWMNGNAGHSQYYGGGSSAYHSNNTNYKHGASSGEASYSRSNRVESSGKVKSSSSRSRSSSSSVSRTRSGSSDNSGSRSSSGKSRSSDNKSDRSSNNDRNK